MIVISVAILRRLLPEAKPSIIEISEPVFRFVTAHHDFANAHHGPILNSDFKKDLQRGTALNWDLI